MCLKLAYTDENTDKYNSVPDISSWQTISMNTVLENESDITEEQINSIVAYLIEKANSSKTIAELQEEIERLSSELEKAKAGNAQESGKKPRKKKKLDLSDEDVARIKTEMRTAGLTQEEE